VKTLTSIDEQILLFNGVASFLPFNSSTDLNFLIPNSLTNFCCLFQYQNKDIYKYVINLVGKK